jgi:hypothetical protein
MHRFLGILSAVALMTAACVPGAPGGGGQAAAMPAKNVEPANKIVFWHAMSGINGDAVNRIVDGFQQEPEQDPGRSDLPGQLRRLAGQAQSRAAHQQRASVDPGL